MCESHACGSKTLISRIQANFFHLVSNLDYFFMKLNLLLKENSQAKWHWMWCLNVCSMSSATLESPQNILLKKSAVIFGNRLEHLQKSLATFGNNRSLSRNLRQHSEIVRTSLKIQVMCWWKSHVFDSENISRYMLEKSALEYLISKVAKLKFKLLALGHSNILWSV